MVGGQQIAQGYGGKEIRADAEKVVVGRGEGGGIQT
jgi:hypothetical protein